MRGFIKKVYYKCGEILENGDFIPYIPCLKLNYAKTYFGKINKAKYMRVDTKEIYEKFNYIALSRFNLDMCDGWWSNEDYDELLDTICHEFAHMLAWEHGKRHTNITEIFIKEVKNIMPDLESAENILS